MKNYLSNKHSWLLLFAFTFLMLSCNFTGKLTKRYKSAEPDTQGCKINEYVSVDVSLIDKDPTTAPAVKALYDLSPKGQAAFINAVNAKETTSVAMISQLKSDLAVPADKTLPEIIDFTRMSKRIQVAVGKVPLVDEGARIEKISIKIVINDSNLRIRSCNRIVTEYQNVDLGKISYTNSNGFEATGSLGIGGSFSNTNSEGDKNTSAQKNGDNTLGSERTTNNGVTNTGTVSKGIGAKFNASRSMSEEVQLKQRLVALNASIKTEDNSLNLFQEGVSGIDLTGNIIADVIFEYINDVAVEKVYFFDKPFLPNGSANSQSNIEIRENYTQTINLTNDITATITFKAVYRRIKKGDKTISESDDAIQLINGKTEDCKTNTATVLIPKSSMRPNTWQFMYKVNNSTMLPLSICNGANMCGEIVFYNYKNALEFLRWLKTGVNNSSIDLSKPIGNKGHTLKVSNINNLIIPFKTPTATDINSLTLQLNQ